MQLVLIIALAIGLTFLFQGEPDLFDKLSESSHDWVDQRAVTDNYEKKEGEPKNAEPEKTKAPFQK